MTRHYEVTSWGGDADIRLANDVDYYSDDENRFLSFEAAKLELLARISQQIEELDKARTRIMNLTQGQADEPKPAPRSTFTGGAEPLLDNEDDMTRRTYDPLDVTGDF